MTTPPPPQAVPGELERALARAMESERARAVDAASRVRQVISFSFLVLIVVVWSVTRSSTWEVYLLPSAIHAGASGLAPLLRRRSLWHHVAPAFAVLDTGLVTAGQALALPTATHPLGVAGFSLGVYVMVVALNALTLRPGVVLTATVSALLGEVALIVEAGIGVPEMVLGALVLGAVAVGTNVLMRRMREVTGRFAASEIARELEVRHGAEVTRAHETIAGMLADSRAQNERLERLQREKEGLTQLLIHDLRSPITVIVGYVDLVRGWLEDVAAPAGYKDALDQALVTATRLTGMTSDLLQISKLEEGRLVLQPAAMDGRDLAGELAAHARALSTDPNLRVELVAETEAPLDADRDLVRRVLENLVGNALRFTPAGGRLRIAVEATATEVVFRVQNDGTPIDPVLRERMFEKYQQGQKARTGWGLGLYFCRLAVEAHRGAIAVEDVGDFATTFSVRLPARRASQPPAPAQTAA